MRRKWMARRAGFGLFVLVLMLSLGASVNVSAVPMLRAGWYPWMPYQYKEQNDQVQTLTGLDIELFRKSSKSSCRSLSTCRGSTGMSIRSS